jgi:hypothetical protein
MKRALVAVWLLTGCVSPQTAIESSQSLDEAYMNAQAIYISALSSMVNYKNECGRREPKLREECWPVVERLRGIARDGIEHRQALDVAYKAGNQTDFDSSVAGLRFMRNAIINEVSRETKGVPL